MKACIYNPYLDTLGGGERYTMAVATTLAKSGYQVDVEWKNMDIKKKLEDRFGIDLSKINFIDDVKRGDGYDVCFWVSDGSIPALKSRNNLLHFQVPFTKVAGRTLLNKVKLMRIKKVVCNSKFTKKIIDKEFGVDSVVLYPPVAVQQFKAKRKSAVILCVSRFSELMQNKGHEVLIQAFKKFSKTTDNYQLVLAGGVEVGADKYIKKLGKIVNGYNIKFVTSPKFSELKELYGSAKFFWSASGFGVNDKREPTRVEHFGITLVEAMSAGCVPLVFNAGGYKEIINNGVNGYLWNKTSDLTKTTRKLTQNKRQVKEISTRAKTDAEKYSYEEFEKALRGLYE